MNKNNAILREFYESLPKKKAREFRHQWERYTDVTENMIYKYINARVPIPEKRLPRINKLSQKLTSIKIFTDV